MREGTGMAEVGRPQRTRKLGVEVKGPAAKARAGLQREGHAQHEVGDQRGQQDAMFVMRGLRS